MDGWNEQISQLTSERDQLKDSLQEVSKVCVSVLLGLPFVFLQTLRPRNYKIEPANSNFTVLF